MALLSFPIRRRIPAPKNVHTLAVFRALQLGDMLCAVPTLRALRKGFPQARISLVGLPWAADFVRRFSAYVDDFIPFPGHPLLPELPVREDQISLFYRSIRSRHFDLAVQLHGSGEITNPIVSAFGATKTAGFVNTQNRDEGLDIPVPYPKTGPEPMRLLRMASALVGPSAQTQLEFPLHPDDWEELERDDLRLMPTQRYFCIHPGARHQNKRWPVACFAEVADRLATEFGLAVVLTGAASEAPLAASVAAQMRRPAINSADAGLSLGALAALIDEAQLLICNDTGVSHMAAGLTVPSVVVFSKADVERWCPMDRALHTCIADPDGQRVNEVVAHARRLLSAFNRRQP